MTRLSLCRVRQAVSPVRMRVPASRCRPREWVQRHMPCPPLSLLAVVPRAERLGPPARPKMSLCRCLGLLAVSGQQQEAHARRRRD